MSETTQLRQRIRAIWKVEAGIIAVTLLAYLLIRPWHAQIGGLLLGEVGGAYVIYSMVRQGHLDDSMQGNALFASGVLGMFTRLVVLAAVMVVAVKVPGLNPYTALVGYLLGFVLIFAGLYGFARDRAFQGKSR